MHSQAREPGTRSSTLVKRIPSAARPNKGFEARSEGKSPVVQQPPDATTLDRAVLTHSWRQPAFRAFALCAMSLLVVLGLANVFGEQPVVDSARAEAGSLEVSAPTRVRGGLFFQGRFQFEARRAMRHVTLVLDRGWQEQLSINTIEPAPETETSRDGRLVLDFGAFARNAKLVAYLQFQVNPAQWLTRRPQGVEVKDGRRHVLRIERTMTVFP